MLRTFLAALAILVTSAALVLGEEPQPYGPIVVTDQDLGSYKFQALPLVIFADTPDDPVFKRQIDLIMAGLDDLQRRNVVILTDTDPAANSKVRQHLRPRGFSLVLLDLDGRVQLRKPAPWHVREITRSIDKAE